jgi:Bacterial protein of unknown function (DUF937)
MPAIKLGFDGLRRERVRLVDVLTGTKDATVVQNFAKSFAIEPAAAKSALGGIVTELAYAIERNTLNRAGIADVIAAMGRGTPERLLDGKADLSSAGVETLGISILETLLGSKDKSRGLANRVARETGLDADQIRAMLPAAASVTMGALAVGTRSQLRDVVAAVPGLAARSPLPLPGETPDYGTVPDVYQMPDQPGSGRWNDAEPARPTDADNRNQRPASGGTIKKQSPLPIPGNSMPRTPRGPNPYDDLSDVIRRGEVQVPAGGSIGNVIRGILGSLLGYKGGGVISGVIRLMIMKWGWRILQSILRRVLTGR